MKILGTKSTTGSNNSKLINRIQVFIILHEYNMLGFNYRMTDLQGILEVGNPCKN